MSPASAIPTARPMMPSSESDVSNTRALPKLSWRPRVAACTPPLGPTSSPNSSIRGLPRSSASRVRRIAVSMLMRGPSGAGTSLAGGGRYPDAARPPRREWIECRRDSLFYPEAGHRLPIRLRQRHLREAGFRFGARACSTSAISFSVSLPARRKA